MDISEVTGLADWIEQWVLPSMGTYEQLVVALEQNANNTTKVPLRDYLEALDSSLSAMPTEQLTKRQSDLLRKIGVYELIGKPGWQFIEATVKQGNYDPASTAQDSRRAKQDLDKLVALFDRVRATLRDVMITGEVVPESSEKLVMFRVQFDGDASIKDVTDLKNYAADWHDIARGITLAVGERPEDVVVKGASTGSIIMTLATTYAAAKLFALIMKEVSEIIKTGLDITNTINDFRKKRILDADVEKVLKDKKQNLEEEGPQEILARLKEQLPYSELSPENEGPLKKSIEKFIDFTKKGGDVDMIPPPPPSETGVGDAEQLEKLREMSTDISDAIREMRSIKADTRRLIETSKS